MHFVLATYNTVNTGTEITIVLSSLSHIMRGTSYVDDQEVNTTWLHFHSGKSVHVNEKFENVMADIEEYYKTHRKLH